MAFFLFFILAGWAPVFQAKRDEIVCTCSLSLSLSLLAANDRRKCLLMLALSDIVVENK